MVPCVNMLLHPCHHKMLRFFFGKNKVFVKIMFDKSGESLYNI